MTDQSGNLAVHKNSIIELPKFRAIKLATTNHRLAPGREKGRKRAEEGRKEGAAAEHNHNLHLAIKSAREIYCPCRLPSFLPSRFLLSSLLGGAQRRRLSRPVARVPQFLTQPISRFPAAPRSSFARFPSWAPFCPQNNAEAAEGQLPSNSEGEKGRRRRRAAQCTFRVSEHCARGQQNINASSSSFPLILSFLPSLSRFEGHDREI